jgi:ferredoxin
MAEGRVAFEVDTPACIRCGACALLCPSTFAMGGKAARVTRQPGTTDQRRLAAAALLNCPTSSIRARNAAEITEGTGEPEAAIPGLYDQLARESEGVRWHLAEVAWDRLAPERAAPSLRALVKEMAFSEHATYSATQRFMQTFAADVQFTQWLSIWFYEETRHPHVLTAWLRRIGAPPADENDFVIRGRVSTPFMKSKMGTLVTNIISEVTAAAAYQTMARFCGEPVLAEIAGFISADEARHAASFFRFARHRLESAEDPARERLDALKVLHFWLNEMQQVTHPVNQMLERLRSDTTGSEALSALSFDFGSVKRRVISMVGLLIDAPLRTPEDVFPALKQMTGDRQDRRWGTEGEDSSGKSGRP